MPPSAHWGKRPRDSASDEPFVRFSELSPVQKMERRREERAEKKERDRTLSYFKSVQRALEEQNSGGGDAGSLTSIVDGFFSELLKLLKADSTFYILRNGTACRVIELALANALLLHVKSLLYVFLGHICELMVSPVASFTLETLLASLSQGLSALGDVNPEGLQAELTEDGVGIHTGSGVPSSATLLRSMADEMCERAEDLIVHDIGGRALRSIVLMLGGRAIRQAPQLQHPVSFPRILGTLAETFIQALEEGYAREYNTATPAEAWMVAVQAPATSLVVQSLLRVSDEGTVVDRCVRRRIEELSYKGKPLLHHLLVDPLGCHVFQSYVQVPPTAAVVEAGDAAALRISSLSRATSDKKRKGERDDAEADAGETLLVPGGADSCCWSRAAELVLLEIDNLLKPGGDLVAQTSYVLQDLVLYAPTAIHLEWLWRRVLNPRLLLLFDISVLTAVLVQVVKRCAFEGVLLTPPAPTGVAVALSGDDNSNASSGNEVSHHGTVLPLDVLAVLRGEAARHVRYSPVPIPFQSAVCARICGVAKQRVSKGAVQYLLVDSALSERGYEVARYLMHLHPSASTLLQHALDKLQRQDLVTIVCRQMGSQFLQQFIKVSALATPKSGASTSSTNAGVSTAMDMNRRGTKATAAAAPTTSISHEAKGPLMRLFRRLQSSLPTLIYNKYAAFMVETLYECASLSVKEALVQALVPIYQEMRMLHHALTTSAKDNTEEEQLQQQQQEEDPSRSAEGEELEGNEAAGGASLTKTDADAETAPSPTQQRFIAHKVMSKCCVEQYVHRKEDWRKLAERQCHVQQLLRRMLLDE